MASDDSVDSVVHRVINVLSTADVPYMLTGSFAIAFHGAPRTTQDINIVIAPNLGSLEKILRQFPEDSYYVSREAALEDTILVKLEWSKMSESERQIRDAAGILRMQGAQLDVEYIDRWVNDLHLQGQWEIAKAQAG